MSRRSSRVGLTGWLFVVIDLFRIYFSYRTTTVVVHFWIHCMVSWFHNAITKTCSCVMLVPEKHRAWCRFSIINKLPVAYRIQRPSSHPLSSPARENAEAITMSSHDHRSSRRKQTNSCAHACTWPPASLHRCTPPGSRDAFRVPPALPWGSRTQLMAFAHRLLPRILRDQTLGLPLRRQPLRFSVYLSHHNMRTRRYLRCSKAQHSRLPASATYLGCQLSLVRLSPEKKNAGTLLTLPLVRAYLFHLGGLEQAAGGLGTTSNVGLSVSRHPIQTGLQIKKFLKLALRPRAHVFVPWVSTVLPATRGSL